MTGEQGWLIGIIEGEGSIFLARKPNQPPRYPTIKVKMTDEDIVRRVCSVAKCGRVFGPHSSPSDTKDCRATGKTVQRKPTWVWRVMGAEAWKLLEDIIPYLGTRRKSQAKMVLEAERYG